MFQIDFIWYSQHLMQRRHYKFSRIWKIDRTLMFSTIYFLEILKSMKSLIRWNLQLSVNLFVMCGE